MSDIKKRYTTVETGKDNHWWVWYDGKALSTYEVTHLLNEYEDNKEDLLKSLKQCEEEKELIKDKLLNLILDYDEISHDNWNFGLKDSVKSIHNDVEKLFKNPHDFKMERLCDDCKYYDEINPDEGNCIKFGKIVDCGVTYCEEFEW